MPQADTGVGAPPAAAPTVDPAVQAADDAMSKQMDAMNAELDSIFKQLGINEDAFA
jgi:hypothetical protein